MRSRRRARAGALSSTAILRPVGGVPYPPTVRIACLGVLAVTTSVAHADGARMLKGPYLQDLAPTSITVMWQLDEAKAGKLIVNGPGGERKHIVDRLR